MEKQTIVIEYVGERPTPQEAYAAIAAMQRAGTYIDTTIQPTACFISEKEKATAMAVLATKKVTKGEGVTIKVEQDPILKGIDKDKAKAFADFLKAIIDG